jgi:VanZ family protein
MAESIKSSGFWGWGSCWLPPLLLAGVQIFILSTSRFGGEHTLPLAQWLHGLWPLRLMGPDQIHLLLRKGFHLVAYGILYLLWFRLLRLRLGLSLGRATLWGLGLCVLVGAGEEAAETLAPGRVGQVSDVILDLAGASIAALLVWGLTRAGAPRPGEIGEA